MDRPEEESKFYLFESSCVPDISVLNFKNPEYNEIDSIPKL